MSTARQVRICALRRVSPLDALRQRRDTHVMFDVFGVYALMIDAVEAELRGETLAVRRLL